MFAGGALPGLAAARDGGGPRGSRVAAREPQLGELGLERVSSSGTREGTRRSPAIADHITTTCWHPDLLFRSDDGSRARVQQQERAVLSMPT